MTETTFWWIWKETLAEKGAPFAIDRTGNRGRIRASGVYQAVNNYTVAAYPQTGEVKIEKTLLRAVETFRVNFWSIQDMQEACRNIIDTLIAYAQAI